jgi:dTDP-4-dehydrorhamnose reductase
MIDILVFGDGYIGGFIKNSLKTKYNIYATSRINNDLIKYDILKDNIKETLSHINFSTKKIAIITISMCSIDNCLINKTKSYQINVVKTKELIKQLNNDGFKVIFLSSDSVFDGKSGNYREDDIKNPLNEYGKHKNIIEEFILQYFPTNVILRLSKSISDNKHKQNLFYQWLEIINKNQDILCIKNNIFNPTYIGDIVNVIDKVIENNINGIYNISSDTAYLRADLARLFLDIGKRDNINVIEQDINKFNFIETRALNTSMNNTKIKQDINIHFRNIDDIIKSFWDKI